MKSARHWLVFLTAFIACNIPFDLQNTPGPVPVADASGIYGVWRGNLQDLNTNSGMQMNLYIQEDAKGFSGTVEFSTDKAITETHTITGITSGDRFQFSDADGRSFWGTFDQNSLHGFIGWDCFECDYWGEFTLARQTDPVPAAASTSPPATPGLILFEGTTDGDIVPASVDAATGLPTATIRVASDDPTKAIFIDANGIVSGYHYIEGQSSHTADIQWTPWHGNGAYALTAYLIEWTSAAGTIIGEQTINISVSGIPDGTPTVSEKFSQLYLERFGFYPPNPAFTRYVRLFPTALDPSQWVSAVYYGDYVYELKLTDDGEVSQFYTYTNFDHEYAICRPAGLIRMLAVIVDYGNTGVDPQIIVDDLHQSLAIANQRWADYATSIGLSQPIVQVELVTALAGAPSTPGQYLTVNETLARTGYDPAQFDVLTEIDLDRDNLATGQYGGLGVSLTGGCRPSGPNWVNIGMNVSSSEFPNVGASVFEHEFIHAMGWQHWWANENGSTPDWTRSGPYWMPVRMFGWVDLDGDGIIEIQDPTPYGIQ
jgi:hypothetical protein